MSYIFPTYFWGHALPKLLNTSYKCFEIVGFIIVPQKVLQGAPYIFNWVEVRTFWRCFPPVDRVLEEEIFGIVACVLRIIVLLKSVSVGKSLA